MLSYFECFAAAPDYLQHLARIDHLLTVARAAATQCESDIETLLERLAVTEHVFSKPRPCYWGLKLVSVRVLWPAPEAYGIEFTLTIGAETLIIPGFEAPGHLHSAAYHGLLEALASKQQTELLARS